MRGKVFLVGAGPGAPGLITVRALEVLREADVVFYDRLVHPSILEHAEQASLIYCGKEPGRHVWNQEEINKAILGEALSGKVVVRLKGGDPFIFGRGGEEAIALEKAGVPFKVIPGVSSATGLPGIFGIPLTHRGFSSSIAMVTGRQDPTTPSAPIDWNAVARLETIVILMGVKELPNIVENLLKIKNAKTPVAIICKGTYPDQKIIKGNLGEIVFKCEHVGLKPPALIIVGRVADFLDRFSFLDVHPLSGMEFKLIGDINKVREFENYFYDSGASIRKIAYHKKISVHVFKAIRDLKRFEWLLFYDEEAVEGFFQALYDEKIDIRSLTGKKFGVPDERIISLLNKKGIFSNIKIIRRKMPDDSLLLTSSLLKDHRKAVSVYDLVTFTAPLNITSVKKDPDYVVLLNPSGIRFIKDTNPSHLIAFTECKSILHLAGIKPEFYFDSIDDIGLFLERFNKAEANYDGQTLK